MRKTRWRFAALVMLGLAFEGCSDVGCPSDRLADGLACKCPEGTEPDAKGKCLDSRGETHSDAGPESTGHVRDSSVEDAAGPVASSDGGPSADGAPSSPAEDSGTDTGSTGGTNGSGGPMVTSTVPDAGGPGTITVPPAGETCDDGNTDPYDACVDHKPAYCGDKVLRTGVEECEPGFGEGWTNNNCVECRRTRYEVCEHHEQCVKHSVQIWNGETRFDLCIEGLCSPFTCNSPPCSNPCPALGVFDVEASGPYCFITCVGDEGCPQGARCDAKSKHCVARNYSPETFDP